MRYLECAIVLDNAAGGASLELDTSFKEAGIEVAAVTPAQARLARLDHRRFGKRQHPALTLTDCFSYALARETGKALLFKREDFAQTNLAPAREPLQ